MSFFHLTIAEDDVHKRTEGYRNLKSMRAGFTIGFAVAMVSGFWYGFVSRGINWNASQTVLILHLASGAFLSLFPFVIYYFLHQKDKEQRWYMLFTPWKLRREPDEEAQHFRQRQLGHILTWALLAVYVSGLLIAIPGLLFYFDKVWMQGYYTSQVLGDIHLWASLILVPLLFVHFLWIARRKEGK